MSGDVTKAYVLQLAPLLFGNCVKNQLSIALFAAVHGTDSQDSLLFWSYFALFLTLFFADWILSPSSFFTSIPSLFLFYSIYLLYPTLSLQTQILAKRCLRQ